MKKLLKRLLFCDGERVKGQLVQIYGRKEVYMEGCKQVLHCDERLIRIRGAVNLRVEGEDLILKEMGDEVLCAKGIIRSVCFEE